MDGNFHRIVFVCESIRSSQLAALLNSLASLVERMRFLNKDQPLAGNDLKESENDCRTGIKVMHSFLHIAARNVRLLGSDVFAAILRLCGSEEGEWDLRRRPAICSAGFC
jgi:hypothetical protein